MIKTFILSDKEYQQIRKMVYDYAGINLTEAKRQLIISRLSKRLRHFQFKSFSEYIQHLKENDNDKSEFTLMINQISTNKTSFFRESIHFDWLSQSFFPKCQGDVRFWCAASSTGEEPYSIVMNYLENKTKLLFRHQFSLMASDINTQVLQTASNGIYPLEMLDSMPIELKKRYFLRGKGKNDSLAMVKPILREYVQFFQINLTQLKLNTNTVFDIIFLRNVLIYFDKLTKQQILLNMLQHLKPGGYLIIGLSDSLLGVNEELINHRNGIYQKAVE